MTEAPKNPKIYHITHVDNLENILRNKELWSDAKRLRLGLECKIVGMSKIKKARLEEAEVKCHRGTMVGEYVPFYFCPRSVMLYILYRGNLPDIDYHEGQEPIIHLQADLRTTVKWATDNGILWAFTDMNARTSYAQFYDDVSQLNDVINWSAVEAKVFRDMLVKEDKQAEFLVYESFPWELVERIGVCNSRIKDRVIEELGDRGSPEVSIEEDWYY